jgi:GNAT superfamily N-acetyltransferase
LRIVGPLSEIEIRIAVSALVSTKQHISGSSVNMEQIAQATVEDITQLCELLTLLFMQETDFQPDIALQKKGLQFIIERPESGRIFRTCVGGRVVGMVSLLLTISTAEGGCAAWVEDMIVHPDLRGEGIGGRLLRHAIAAARSLGCSRLTLLTDGDNTSSMRFYENAGFVRSQMVPFRLKL